MKQPISTLKQFFGQFKVPTGNQFGDLVDSFFHKDSKIPAAQVEGWTDDSAVELPAGELELPELADKNKYINVFGGATGKIYTYKGTPYPILANNQAILFWSGTDETWRVQDEMPLPMIPVANEAGDNEDVAMSQSYVTNLEKTKADLDIIYTPVIISNIASFPTPLNNAAYRPDGVVNPSDTYTYSNNLFVKSGDILESNFDMRYIAAFRDGVVSLSDGGGLSNSSNPSTAITNFTIREGVTSVIVTSSKNNAGTLVIKNKTTKQEKVLRSEVNLLPEKITNIGDPIYRKKSNAIHADETSFIVSIDGDPLFVSNIVSFDTPVSQGAMNALGTIGAEGNYVHTKPMVVNEGDLIKFNLYNRYVTAFVNGVAVRELGAGMVNTTNPATDIREYIVPPTVTAIVASPRLIEWENFQVNVYKSEKLQKFSKPAPVEKVSEFAIHDNLAKNQNRSALVSIAPKIYAITDQQISIYLDTTIKYWRDYSGYSDVKLGISSQLVMDRYTQSIVSGNAPSCQIRLANEFFEIINIQNFSIISSSLAIASAKKVMVLGSSTTGQGKFLDFILDSTARSGLKFVGTKYSYANKVENKVLTEGRAGRTLGFYMALSKNTDDHNPFMQPSSEHKYYGVTGFWAIVKANQTSGSQYQGYGEYIGKFGPNGYLLNPSINDVMYDNAVSQFRVWDGSIWVSITESTLAFSFNVLKYMSTWTVDAPDILHVLLGSNDFNGMSEPQALTFWSVYKSNLDAMVSSYKSANPNIKIVLAIPYCSALQGAEGTFEDERKKRAFWILSSKMIEFFSSKEITDNIYVVDYLATIDRQAAFSATSRVPYNNYNGTYNNRYVADTTHLSENGFVNQLGVLFAGIIQHLRSI